MGYFSTCSFCSSETLVALLEDTLFDKELLEEEGARLELLFRCEINQIAITAASTISRIGLTGIAFALAGPEFISDDLVYVGEI